jgi:hypothetical protein
MREVLSIASSRWSRTVSTLWAACCRTQALRGLFVVDINDRASPTGHAPAGLRMAFARLKRHGIFTPASWDFSFFALAPPLESMSFCSLQSRTTSLHSVLPRPRQGQIIDRKGTQYAAEAKLTVGVEVQKRTLNEKSIKESTKLTLHIGKYIRTCLLESLKRVDSERKSHGARRPRRMKLEGGEKEGRRKVQRGDHVMRRICMSSRRPLNQKSTARRTRI